MTIFPYNQSGIAQGAYKEMILVFESESYDVSGTGRNVVFRKHAFRDSTIRNLTSAALVCPDARCPLPPQTLRNHTGLSWAC